MTQTLTGRVLTPSGWVPADVSFAAQIDAIAPRADAPDDVLILPGCVDLHCHGGGGGDVMQGEAGIRTAARLHARTGTTSWLATTVTAPLAEIEHALRGIAAVMAAPGQGEARILGVHLEGPFINPGKLGAQPPFAIPADVATMRHLLTLAPITVVTLAPECDPGDALFNFLLAQGIRPQIGHSLCSHAQARAALQRGAGLTHFYNAMTPLNHRTPGAVGAGLAYAEYAEIIPDLVHVAPDAILAARRAIPRLYGVTDATAGAGMPDGPYQLGQHRVQKIGAHLTLPDGTLAGSALTTAQALRNLVSIGLPLAEASQRLSTFPADWLGRAEFGRIEPGANADFLVLSPNLSLRAVYVGGQAVALDGEVA
jgi:N-acetylglucosamine-6-phosphate deacetylase